MQHSDYQLLPEKRISEFFLIFPYLSSDISRSTFSAGAGDDGTTFSAGGTAGTAGAGAATSFFGTSMVFSLEGGAAATSVM